MTGLIHKPRSGGTYFFSVRLADHNSDLLLTQIAALRDATRRTLRRHPFQINAIAVLPSAIHTLWTLPPGDDDVSTRWAMLKAMFTRNLGPAQGAPAAQIRASTKGIWQRRFWEHRIRDAEDYTTHMRMIYTSPVQAGLCGRPQAWAHSSIHRDGADEAGQFLCARVGSS